MESLGVSGTTRVVPVGPLLAVLLSLQQGRVGDRSTVTFPDVGHFAGFGPVSGLFLRRFQRPNTAPFRGRARDGAMLHAGGTSAERPWITAPDQGPCRFLNAAADADAPPVPGLTQSFKRQPFQALSLRSVLAGRTPPPI